MSDVLVTIVINVLHCVDRGNRRYIR